MAETERNILECSNNAFLENTNENNETNKLNMGTTIKLSTADSYSRISTFDEHFVSDLVINSAITFSKYPLFYKLLQFSLTIPTGSVKSEKSFSALRRVINYNQITMWLNRLGQMSLLATGIWYFRIYYE